MVKKLREFRFITLPRCGEVTPSRLKKQNMMKQTENHRGGYAVGMNISADRRTIDRYQIVKVK